MIDQTKRAVEARCRQSGGSRELGDGLESRGVYELEVGERGVEEGNAHGDSIEAAFEFGEDHGEIVPIVS